MGLQVLGACLLLVLLNLTPGARSVNCTVSAAHEHLVSTIKGQIVAASTATCATNTTNCGIEHTKSATGMLQVKFLCGACPKSPPAAAFTCINCSTGSGVGTAERGVCNKYSATNGYIMEGLLKERTQCNYYSGDESGKHATFNDTLRVYCGKAENCASSVWWEGATKKAFIGCKADCDNAVKGKEMAYGKNAVCTDCSVTNKTKCTITAHSDVADEGWTPTTPKPGDTKTTTPAGTSTTTKGGGGDNKGETTTGAAAESPSNAALTAAITGALLVLAGAAN